MHCHPPLLDTCGDEASQEGPLWVWQVWRESAPWLRQQAVHIIAYQSRKSQPLPTAHPKRVCPTPPAPPTACISLPASALLAPSLAQPAIAYCTERGHPTPSAPPSLLPPSSRLSYRIKKEGKRLHQSFLDIHWHDPVSPFPQMETGPS